MRISVLIFCIFPLIIQEGKYEEAIFYYNEALKLEPDYITALQGKSTVLCTQGKPIFLKEFKRTKIIPLLYDVILRSDREIFRSFGGV